MLRKILVLIMVLGSLQAQPIQADAPESSIERVLANRLYYHGKEVVVEGEVEKIKYTTSSSGNPYTLFDLHDDEENSVGVYTKGRIPIFKGAKVRVVGKFKKEKEYAIFKFKNVIKAKEVEKLG
ncbi:MAG: hypothetical protein HYW01_10150 [Deltaproteobacteria bacterium]|nr:hypothetical protein [Deltaproteobacteria bacterium]